MSTRPTPGMTIGALAHAAGLHVETIRYYQRRGLMSEPDRPPGGIRRYDDSALERLHFIRTAQSLGFSLDEVANLLILEDGAGCEEARELGERKLASVREKILNLRRIERVLEELVSECTSTPQGAITCPLLASLHETAV